MKIILFIISLLFLSDQIRAEVSVKFVVHVDSDRIDAPVAVPLDGINYNTDQGELLLYEVTANGMRSVPCQLEPGHSARLWFLLEGLTRAKTSREFVLKIEKTGNELLIHQKVRLQKQHNDMQLVFNDKPVLSYRFGVMYPPEDVSPLYRRSGFIHPLWSPAGEELTRIQPSDHYHHYGIWGPWTKTTIDEREVDFWNLAKGEGTVKFTEFLSTFEGAVFSGFQALQQHIDFGGIGGDQVAMNEVLDIRAWNAGDKIWIIDYTTSLTSPLENGIMLDAYRYGGGIGFRSTQKWHKDNCTLLTSEGKARVEADGTSARWCMVEGESGTPQGRAGILFLSHPSNRMHPEPMRVWPLEVRQGRGDLYFQFTPIRDEEWKIEPNQHYTLKYRMIVFDGALNTETAERFWNSFANLPLIEFTEINKN